MEGCVPSYREMSHEYLYYVFSILSVAIISPMLFINEDSDDLEDSVFLDVIESNSFVIMIVASLVIAIPLTLDLIIDTLTTSGLKKQLGARVAICITLWTMPLLHVYFSLYQKHVVATWTIIRMRSFMNGAITLQQIEHRSRKNETTTLSYAALLCWIVGSTMAAYGTDSPIVFQLSKYIRFGAVLLVFICGSRHFFLFLRGNLQENWYNEWQQLTFEALLATVLIVGIVILFAWSNTDNVYDIKGEQFFGLTYLGIAFLLLLSTIITNEYRYEYSQAYQKLGLKRLFVRYVSHEIRTPLNSCVLGLKYLKTSLLDSSRQCVLEEMTGILDEVSEGCNTAIDFMNNLLLYEKIDTMELPLYVKREDLSVLCSKVCKSFQLSARQLELDLELDIHEALRSTEPNSVRYVSPMNDVESTGDRFRAYVAVDGPKIMVVLRNLMSNALKFTPKNGTVSLRLFPISLPSVSGKKSVDTSCLIDMPPSVPDEATHFRVVISDSGQGLSSQEREQLFKKIVQFSPNEFQHGGGSGIGLFLSQKIMTGHKCSIQVHSEGIKGRGTQFFIDFPRLPSDYGGSFQTLCSIESSTNSAKQRLKRTLNVMSCFKKPFSQVANMDDNDTFSAGEPPETSPPPVPPPLDLTPSLVSFSRSKEVPTSSQFRHKDINELSILIVDDSALNRKMLRRTLRQQGIGSSFHDAGDGLELLHLLGIPETDCVEIENVPSSPSLFEVKGQTEFDVILLDNNMPNMNGSDAVKRLRLFGYEGLIVGLTGSALEEDLNSFCAAGVDFALPKPFSVEDFISIVRLYL